VPLLPALLGSMLRLAETADDATMRSLLLELCLTVPARLSSLLPFLPLLLRPVLAALRSPSHELTNLGLRTLEFWADNLAPSFLYPLLAQRPALLSALMAAVTVRVNAQLAPLSRRSSTY